MIRTAGVLGLVGIALAVAVPGAGPLVGLDIYTIFVSGPLSPLFPVGLEPVLMLFGRVYLPVVVAATATAAALYIEFVNYAWVAGASALLAAALVGVVAVARRRAVTVAAGRGA